MTRAVRTLIEAERACSSPQAPGFRIPAPLLVGRRPSGALPALIDMCPRLGRNRFRAVLFFVSPLDYCDYSAVHQQDDELVLIALCCEERLIDSL